MSQSPTVLKLLLVARTYKEPFRPSIRDLLGPRRVVTLRVALRRRNELGLPNF
jgi:hypothetical protein